jgi:Spy/CpxP family protein refolding chaperone
MVAIDFKKETFMKTLTTTKFIACYALLALTTVSCSLPAQQPTPAKIALAAAPSPYAGEQAREIKSLSASEMQALHQGAGMGYAKAAELNGYPGPMHVLELARPLQLSAGQRQASEQLLAQHKATARRLGNQLVDAERALDTAFASKQIDAARIALLTQQIGNLQASLRAEHLQTHLRQTALLNPQQIASYQSLRGYDKSGGQAHQHTH